MNARDFTWLLAGAVMGSIAGMFVMALMVIAKQSDEAGGVSDAHADADQGSKAQGKAE